MPTPLSILKTVMNRPMDELFWILDRTKFTADQSNGISVVSNPENLLLPELQILLAHMRLKKLSDIGAIPFEPIYHCITALHDKWLGSLKDTFFDPRQHWTTFDVQNEIAIQVFQQHEKSFHLDAIRFDRKTNSPFHSNKEFSKIGIRPSDNLVLVPKVDHLFFSGDQARSWKEKMVLEQNPGSVEWLRNIETISLINAHSIPAPIRPRILDFVGSISLKETGVDLERVEELSFVDTQIEQETLQYILTNAPSLKRLTFVVEPNLHHLPDWLKDQNISIRCFHCPVATPIDQHDQKIASMIFSPKKDQVSVGLELLRALRETPINIQLESQTWVGEPLIHGVQKLQNMENLRIILDEKNYGHCSIIPTTTQSNWSVAQDAKEFLRRVVL